MRVGTRRFLFKAAISAIALIVPASMLVAQDAHFHNAPASSNQSNNPYVGQQAAIAAGSKLYTTNCGSCHGIKGRGTGNIPPLARGPTQSAPDGEVFWFITTGSVDNGMPSWATLPEQKRWQIVAYLKSLKNSTSSATNESAPPDVKPVKTNAPPPQPPYTDFRFEQPGKIRRITAQDLPAPYASGSASNAPQLVARPRGAWPKAPTGFSVQQYAKGLDNPRLIRTAPNGDFFPGRKQQRGDQGIPRNYKQW
jgi:mono/diheme cytochrome c family protein